MLVRWCLDLEIWRSLQRISVVKIRMVNLGGDQGEPLKPGQGPCAIEWDSELGASVV